MTKEHQLHCVINWFPGGRFTPASFGSAPLSSFDGQDVKGTWTMVIRDNAGGDAGIINNLELRFAGCTAPGFFPKGTCGEDFVWTFSDNVSDNGCNGDVITRTWTAKDAIKQCSFLYPNNHSK